jgi:hypothetical protein
MMKLVQLRKSGDGEDRVLLAGSIATANRRICDTIANVRNDAIVRLFCPTGQRLHPALEA